MFQDKIVKAIVVMAGQGARFGANTPKQFHKLGGKTLYIYALEAMLHNGLIDEVILVVPFESMEEVRKEVSHYQQKPIHIIRGASERQGSSWQGLLAAGPETGIVLIHDGVRPFVTQEILNENIEKAALWGAVDTCIPTYDTLAMADSKGFVETIPDRSRFLRGQTPQTFSYELLLRAHLEAQRKETKVTDDCSLVLALGEHPWIAKGSDYNIKITTELDLFLAEQLLYLRKKEEVLAPSQGLQGKIYIVVGGNGGIGKAICRELASNGAIALVVSRSSKEWPCDVTLVENVKTTFAAIHKQYGLVDGLINSAGNLQIADLKSIQDDIIQKQVDLNLTSAILLCKYAPIKSRGHIINMASSSYSRGRKSYTVYSAAKSGLVNFTMGLAEERSDLCINAIVPQRTKTAMRKENFPHEEQEGLLDPEEVAKEVLKVLSMESITGEIIPVTKKKALQPF